MFNDSSVRVPSGMNMDDVGLYFLQFVQETGSHHNGACTELFLRYDIRLRHVRCRAHETTDIFRCRGIGSVSPWDIVNDFQILCVMKSFLFAR